MQKVKIKNIKKNQFQLITKNVFVTSDEVFEAFFDIADGLTIDNDEYIHLVERSKI